MVDNELTIIQFIIVFGFDWIYITTASDHVVITEIGIAFTWHLPRWVPAIFILSAGCMQHARMIL